MLFPVDAQFPAELQGTEHSTNEKSDLKLGVWVQQHQKPLLSSALQHHECTTKQQAVSQCVNLHVLHTSINLSA